MPNNFVGNDDLQELIQVEACRVKEVGEHVSFLWQMYRQMPSEVSLANVYGAMSGLVHVYRIAGCLDAARAILDKMGPMLYHLLQYNTDLHFQHIFAMVCHHLDLEDYAKATKVASKCIKIIMERNSELEAYEQELLLDELKDQFLKPIEKRKRMRREALRVSQLIEITPDWYEAEPAGNSLERADFGYGILMAKWQGRNFEYEFLDLDASA